MPNSPTQNKTTRKPRKPSPTARILENVELLVALYEEQGSLPSDSSAPTDTDAIEKLVVASVEKLLDQRLGALEERIAAQIDSLPATEAPPSDSIDALVELVSEQMSQQTQAITEKIDSFADLVKQPDTDTDANHQSNEEVKSILSDFQTVVVEFKDKLQSLEEAIELQATTFESKAQAIQADVEQLVEKFTANNSATTEPAVEPPPTAAPAAPIVEDESSHWQKQKEAMLAKYGIDPEYRPLDEPSAQAEPEKESVSALETAAAQKLEGLHQSINSISPEDKDAIEQLKRDLNSKLRDAEVELSINRARLSQERAKLEQKQSELDHRTADLEAKLRAKASDNDDPSKKGGFMTRFTRHLGK